MGTLHLVRHGQASFGADDYDLLSPLGQRQALRLGEYWRERGQAFDAVYSGTLRRHDETLAGIVQGLGGAPAALRLPALNEYDSLALIRAVHPEPLVRPDPPALSPAVRRPGAMDGGRRQPRGHAQLGELRRRRARRA